VSQAAASRVAFGGYSIRRENDVLRTRFAEQYGLDMPFICAGMGFVGMPPLVAAVSNAGGMGTFGASPLPPEAGRNMIQQIRSMTSQPFGVNFITPFTEDAHIEVCIEEKVPVVSFHWEAPPEAFISRLQDGGAKVWMQVGSVRQAHEVARLGVDAVIVQGSEAGGHVRGAASTLVLVPAVIDAIAPLPVVAAGGIADGRGVAAALALGAEAVWVGTRMVATQEANVHDEYKRRIVTATETDTIVTTLFGPEWPDAPARVLRNRIVNEWAGREKEIVHTTNPSQSIERTLLGAEEYIMPKFSAFLPTPETTGDFEEMMMVAGECSGLVKEIRPAGEIVHEMMEEARRIIVERLSPLADGFRDAGVDDA
jgi:NAD(P)H-dependent flavin oxidoreductase YrpB (nitropropane dioxygenase family)